MPCWQGLSRLACHLPQEVCIAAGRFRRRWKPADRAGKPRAEPVSGAGQKNGGPCGAAKFREETSKKADSAARGRIAATHKVGVRSFVCKRYFAMQHRKMLDIKATGW
jgi:hypothetical protein